MGCSQGGGARVSGRSAGSAEVRVPYGVNAKRGRARTQPFKVGAHPGFSLAKATLPDLTRLSVVCKYQMLRPPNTRALLSGIPCSHTATGTFLKPQ